MDEDPPENPFKLFTNEYKIYTNIASSIDCYQRNENYDYLHKPTMFDDLTLPKRPANKVFVKRLINKFDFQFSVSAFEEEIARRLPSPPNKEPYERFDAFFKKSIDALQIFHRLYLNHELNGQPIRNSAEAIKRVLLDEASVDRKQSEPLTIKQLLINVNDKLLLVPRVMTNLQMHGDYLKHLPKKVIKVKKTVKKTTILLSKSQQHLSHHLGHHQLKLTIL